MLYFTDNMADQVNTHKVTGKKLKVILYTLHVGMVATLQWPGNELR
jgi:hypothetical protein